MARRMFRGGLLQRLFKIQPGEERRVALMVLYSTAGMGGVNTVGSATGSALFFSGLPAAAVPYALIIPALGTVLVLLLYNWVAARVRLDRLVLSALLVMLAGVAVLRFLLDTAVGTSFGVLGGTFFWLSLLSTLVTTQFWTFAGQIFNPREARRLFGLISVGGTVAALVAGVALSALVSVIGVKNLLFVVSLGLIGCAVCVGALARGEPGAHVAAGARAASGGRVQGSSFTGDLTAFRRSPLLWMIGALTVVLALLIYIPIYQMGRALQETFSADGRQMVATLGAVTFWASLAALIIQFTVTERILARYGVIVALGFMPAAAALGGLSILLTGGALWAVALLWTNQRTVRRTITDPAINVLYLPLPAEFRIRAKVLVESLTHLTAIGLGVGLIIVQSVSAISFIAWSYPIIILAGVWLLLLPQVRRQYILGLAESVRQRRLLRDTAPAPGLPAREPQPEVPQAQLDAELGGAYALHLWRADIGSPARGSLLDDALAARIRQALDRIFGLLGVLHPGEAPALALAQQALDGQANPRQALAVELVDSLLARREKKTLLPLLEGSPDEITQIARQWLRLPGQPPAARLAALTTGADAWLRCCALWQIGTQRLTDLAGLVDAAGHADDSLVRETALTAGHMLDPAPEAPASLDLDRPLTTIQRVAFLRGVELWSAVPGEALVTLARLAREVTFPAGTRFIRQGEPGDCLYVVVSGDVRIVVEGTGQIAAGASTTIIGELALITQSARTAHGEAVTAVRALQIDHDPFWTLLDAQPVLAQGVMRLLAQRLESANARVQARQADGDPAQRPAPSAPAGPDGARPPPPRADPYAWATARLDSDEPVLAPAERVAFLQGVELFAGVPDAILLQVAALVQEVSFAAGERFIRQGELGDCLYVIVDGTVSIAMPGAGEIAQGRARSLIGELAVVAPGPRRADCIALTDVLALRIACDLFWELLAAHPALVRGIIRMLARRCEATLATLGAPQEAAPFAALEPAAR